MSASISVEGVGKSYMLGRRTERYTALRDVLTERFATLGRRMFGAPGAKMDATRTELFWALRGVSFKVNSGERLGIVGRNGAGKSTLLKILSRVTDPTEGRAVMGGRVASLLEVGTGFHPELTGRENVFLNGAILGMTKVEIRRKFDEIVAFAGVEKFLDTPVKRFSSGMYVRLAFAVAAHLEPEILIVDEVLAVGDADFQRKCMGKMEASSQDGRTILFVSHNMNAIRRLCDKAILLDSGHIEVFGTSEEVCNRYLASQGDIRHGSAVQEQIRHFPSDPAFRLHDVEIMQDGNPVRGLSANGAPIDVRVTYELMEEIAGLRVFVDVLDGYGDLLFRTFHDDQVEHIPTMPSGKYRSELTIPEALLAPGNITLSVKAGIYRKRYTIPEKGVNISLQVEHTSEYNRAYPGDPIRGKLCPLLDWRVTRVS